MSTKNISIMMMTRNGVEIVVIDVDSIGASCGLHCDHSRYFNISDDTVFIPISNLIASRARPKGVVNAAKLMQSAFEGHQARRAPITVRPWGDGLYVVEDGNSTLVNAVASGWPDIAARVAGPDETAFSFWPFPFPLRQGGGGGRTPGGERRPPP